MKGNKETAKRAVEHIVHKNKKKYNSNPNRCSACGEILSYEKVNIFLKNIKKQYQKVEQNI